MTAHDVQTAATAPETGAVPEPAHGAEIVVPLNRLKASPRNARKVKHSAAAIEALAASIRAKGVLQAPVVEIERDREGATTGRLLADHQSAVRVTVWRGEALVFSGPSAECAAWLSSEPQRRSDCPAISHPDQLCSTDCGRLRLDVG